jgi:hypothetical protein
LRSTIAFWISIAQRSASTNAAELHYRAVAGALDDATVMNRDGRIDEIAAKRPEPG